MRAGTASLRSRSYEGPGYDLHYDRAGERYEPAVGLKLREYIIGIDRRIAGGMDDA